MSVTISARTRSYRVSIELQAGLSQGANRVIIYVQSPDRDEHHRIHATVLPGVDLADIAFDLDQALGNNRPWSHDRNIGRVLQFIRDNPNRITSP